MRGIYIILLASLIHFGWALDMLLYPETALVTPMSYFYLLFHNTIWIGVALITSSVLATWAILRKPDSFVCWLSLLPQQSLLILSGYSSIVAVLDSAYADGILRSSHFIFRDQWPNICIMFVHSFYMLSLIIRIQNQWLMKRRKAAIKEIKEHK